MPHTLSLQDLETQRKELTQKFETSITLLSNLSQGVILKNRAEFGAKVAALKHVWDINKEKLMQATTVDEVLCIKKKILADTDHNRDQSGTDLAVSYITHHAYMLYGWEN